MWNRICFTLNNYTTEEHEQVLGILVSENTVYGICGREVGESGTPHLQGFIHSKTRRRLGTWKNLLGNRLHIEQARGTDMDNKEYCSKDGDFAEHGEPVARGKCRYGRLMDQLGNDAPLSEMDPELLIKHYGNIRALKRDLPDDVQMVQYGGLFKWQLDVLNILSQQNNRRITFIVDESGGMGKSYLTKWMLSYLRTWGCTGGKMADLMYSHSQMSDAQVSIYFTPWADSGYRRCPPRLRTR